MKAQQLASLFIALLVGSGAHASVFGEDDRKEYDLKANNAGLFSPVVRIKTSKGICTGSYVDSDIVVTASHCLGLHEQSIEVMAGYNKGESLETTEVEGSILRGSTSDEIIGMADANDWVLMTTKKPLGEKFGFYQIEAGVKIGTLLTTAGFNADIAGGETLSTVRNCKVRGRLFDILKHDCDSVTGSSGGPLLRCLGEKHSSCRLVGTIVGGFASSEYELQDYYAVYGDKGSANIAVTGKTLIDALDWYRTQRKNRAGE